MAQSAGASNPLVGTWKLVSAYWQLEGRDEHRNLYGDNPTGFAILTADGRMMAIITAANRQPDAGPAALFSGMMAYSGRYRLQGANSFVTDVDAAWHPNWVGTEQLRSFKQEGNTMSLMTGVQDHPSLAGARGRGVLKWRRE